MASLTADLREWAIDTARLVFRLLVAAGLSVFVSRGVSEQFPPDGATLAFTLLCGTIIVAAVAFQVGRGYERA